MTRRGILAALLQTISTQKNIIMFEQPKEVKISINMPLVVIADGRTVRITPAELMDALGAQPKSGPER